MIVWREDVLGAGFECADLDLGSDSEGPLVATLVRSLPRPRGFVQRLLRRERLLEDVDVLYVHGWSDYFFQREMAAFWTDRGARFFALDLRKYGRSLREGQTAGYIERLDDYHQEIGLAVAAISGDAAISGNAESAWEVGGATSAAVAAVDAGSAGRFDPEPGRRLVLLGHSTGGLVLSLWAAQHPGGFDALVLNSPWLEFQLASAGRQLLTPLITLSSRLHPLEVAPQLDYGYYTRAQREVGPQGELATVDTAWRPERTHAVRGGWLRAILDGHARVSRGLGIDAPIEVLLSAHSAAPIKWSEELTRADSVLDVDEVAKAALRLGSSVTVDRIDDALHDVFLSREHAREEAYARLERWLIGWQAANRSAPEHGPDRLGS
ncbi:MAG: alpha/beta hydrolase [Leucobacter sp.]